MDTGLGVLAELPEELRYLVEPALRYGRYQADDDIFDFLERANEQEMEELARVAERVRLHAHFPRVTAFLAEHPITESEQAARLYFLFGVLDYADLTF